MGNNWQQPHSAQGSRQSPFWLGYMHEPQTLHAYWISEKLEQVPAKQNKQNSPILGSKAEAANQFGVGQQQGVIPDVQTHVPASLRVQHPAEAGSSPVHAAVATEQQHFKQQEQQQLISPTASDASETELDVSAMNSEQDPVMLDIAAQNASGETPHKSADKSGQIGDATSDANKGTSPAAGLHGSASADLPAAAGSTESGSSKIDPLESGSSLDTQLPGDFTWYSRLAKQETESSAAQKTGPKPIQSAADSLTAQERYKCPLWYRLHRLQMLGSYIEVLCQSATLNRTRGHLCAEACGTMLFHCSHQSQCSPGRTVCTGMPHNCHHSMAACPS